MATSGTYDFLPSIGELVLAAYRRIGIHRAEIINEHLADAKNECNLLQATWGNLGPTLWTVDLQSVVCVEGQVAYSVPENTIMVLDAYISIPNGDGTTSDRIITALSRTEYASLPEKSTQGSPTSYWYDRLVNPAINLWPVPDGAGPYTLNYYRFTQMQDAVIAGALQPAIPFLWLDAYVAGLAHRFAMIYKPEMEAVREAAAVKAYNAASMQGVEGTPLYLGPQTSSYWR